MRVDLHLYNDTTYDQLMECDINEPDYQYDPIRTHALFTDADLARDGHRKVVGGGAGSYITDNWKPTHVAIPVEQYVRIFGEL